MKTLAAMSIVGVALAGLSSSASGIAERTEAYWLVLGSNRDGTTRGYSVRADGARLTPILRARSMLVPASVSADGGTIAYAARRHDHPRGIYVSRASGAGLHRVFAGSAFGPALSRDGRLLAFTTRGKPGIWIVGTDGRGLRRLTNREDGSPAWSPDGKALVFFREIGDFAGVIVVQPLQGPRRVLAWSVFAGAAWSPDGRWVAYNNDDDLWLIRSDGTQRHRIAGEVGGFDWAPDGRRLAFTTGGDVAIVPIDGRGRRLHPRVYVAALRWSPDGRRLALVADGYPSHVWTIGVDGRGLRRVTNEGSNGLLGWTRVAPVRARAGPIPRTEHVVGHNALSTRSPISVIAADGSRVAFSDGTTATDCRHVALWIPARRSVLRLPNTPAPCGEISIRDGLGRVRLAGTSVAWVESGGGNMLEERVFTATLARPSPVEVGRAVSDDHSGTLLTGLAGKATLVAFSVEQRCDPYNDDERTCPRDPPGGFVAATVYRVGGAGPCPFDRRVPRACTPVVRANRPLAVLAVDAGRIAVRTETGIRLLTGTGGVLRDLPAEADAVALSGNRLAVRTADGVDVYDVGSGHVSAKVAVLRGTTLEDLEGEILVTASGPTVTLRRLGDGRTAAFDAAGRARAQLEPQGLFVAGRRRLTFTPMADVLRRLGG